MELSKILKIAKQEKKIRNISKMVMEIGIDRATFYSVMNNKHKVTTVIKNSITAWLIQNKIIDYEGNIIG